jgi:Na+-translocating ferredoxin:NAD+ oxidoreductase subunit E
MAKSLLQEFTKGLWKEIPPFRLVLGLCPVLGVTTSMKNGIGMGLGHRFVLLCSNILISAAQSDSPRSASPASSLSSPLSSSSSNWSCRPSATSCTSTLGVFIPLIVVNCIVLGRAEAFASKNRIIPSTADGLGIGLGFTSLAALGAVREMLGKGGLKGPFSDFSPYDLYRIFGASFEPFAFWYRLPAPLSALA